MQWKLVAKLLAGPGPPQRGTFPPHGHPPERQPEHAEWPADCRGVERGDFWRDQNRAEFVCTAGGTPGTWRQTAPACVTSDPASGTFPTGYLILNVIDGTPQTRGEDRGRNSLLFFDSDGHGGQPCVSEVRDSVPQEPQVLYYAALILNRA